MSTQAADHPDPAEPYEVIHLGGEAAVIVPLAELRRLHAVERHASPEALEEAEIEATLADAELLTSELVTNAVKATAGQQRPGLFLVAALSARWDWYPTQDPPGKVIWCELEPALARQQTS